MSFGSSSDVVPRNIVHSPDACILSLMLSGCIQLCSKRCNQNVVMFAVLLINVACPKHVLAVVCLLPYKFLSPVEVEPGVTRMSTTHL